MTQTVNARSKADHSRTVAPAAVPTWFGPQAQRLFAWVHDQSPGTAAPAVILCPPLGREQTNAYYAYRRLAVALAATGVKAIRFDYDSAGDSVGDERGAGRTDAWLKSIELAIDLARQHGASSISLVGMRMGSLLAELAAERLGGVEALVLWDPCASGRSFVRHQRALELLRKHGGSDPESAGSAPGGLIDPQTLDELGTIAGPSDPERPPVHTLVLHRPQDPGAAQLLQRLAPRSVQEHEIFGQPELMDVEALRSVVPVATIARVADWLSSTLLPDGPQLSAQPAERPVAVQAATIKRGTCSGEITERFVALGPLGLFGIETVGDLRDPSLPTIVFLNTGKDWRVGSNRLWVRLSREWAELGLRCVRFDLSGLGDSPVRTSQMPEVVRAPEAFEDVADAVRALSPQDPSNVILVGLCSGAYQALESGLGLMPRGILAVNPLLAFAPPEMANGPMDRRRQICMPTTSVSVRAYRRFVPAIFRRASLPVAWRLRRVLSSRRSKPRWLEQLLDGGVDVFCVCGDQEAHQLPQVTARATEGSSKSVSLRVEVIDGLDHALVPPDHQLRVAEMFTAHLASRFALKAGPTRSAS